jgi:hypothetical protein
MPLFFRLPTPLDFHRYERMNAFWFWAKGAWENPSADIIQDISGFIIVMGAEFLETAGFEKIDRAGTELAMVTLATAITVIIWYIKGPMYRILLSLVGWVWFLLKTFTFASEVFWVWVYVRVYAYLRWRF